MILACHTLLYSDDAPATRAFFRDVLGFSHVDDGDGWLIFRTGPSEMGVHPTSGEWEGEPYASPRHQQFSFICDDIAATKAELEARGATFSSDIQDHGYGLVAMLQVPGADDIQLYEPRHTTAHDL
jgi:catechol 2,3-dioxygenase-like lactoylglutathione lyase family enzyme